MVVKRNPPARYHERNNQNIQYYTSPCKMRQDSVDFNKLKRKIQPHIKSLLCRLLPGGKIIGHEYIVLNPNRHDKHLGSFKINVKNGKWSDFAINKTGDFISLWSYIRSIQQIEAAKELAAIVKGVA